MTERTLSPLLCAVASLVLRYPSEDVLGRRSQLAEITELAGLRSDLPATPAGTALRRFLDWWQAIPGSELQQSYVETFDLHKRACLYLTYYLYGDRRQRGQEFVRLKHVVEAEGYRFAGRELPDYLPLLLEFAAREPVAGSAMLAEHRVGLELLASALRDAGSPYADAVDAVRLGLPPLDEAGRAVVERLAAEGPPTETVGLEPFAPPEVMPESAWGTPPR